MIALRPANLVGLLIFWLLLAASWRPDVLLLGLAVSVVALAVTRPLLPQKAGPTRPLTIGRLVLIVRFLLYYLREVWISAWHVALYVLNPRIRVESTLVRYHTTLRGQLAIAVYSVLITLTPGTMTLHFDESSRRITVHWLRFQGREDASQLIVLESWVRELFS
ncbi:MAG: Na+/H+ antiporter subunit E [Bacillota bacterium]